MRRLTLQFSTAFMVLAFGLTTFAQERALSPMMPAPSAPLDSAPAPGQAPVAPTGEVRQEGEKCMRGDQGREKEERKAEKNNHKAERKAEREKHKAEKKSRKPGHDKEYDDKDGDREKDKEINKNRDNQQLDQNKKDGKD